MTEHYEVIITSTVLLIGLVAFITWLFRKEKE